MKDFIKRIKGDFLLSSIFSIILGIILIIWGGATLILLGRMIGIILLLIGAAYLLNFFMGSMNYSLNGIVGGVIALIGIWILIEPKVIVSIVPIVIGVVLIFHGVKSITYSIESRDYGNERWGIGVLLGVVSIILGVLCIVGAFGIMKIAFAVIGIALIYSGISNLWVAFRTTKAETAYHKKMETIDVEFKDE